MIGSGITQHIKCLPALQENQEIKTNFRDKKIISCYNDYFRN